MMQPSEPTLELERKVKRWDKTSNNTPLK